MAKLKSYPIVFIKYLIKWTEIEQLKADIQQRNLMAFSCLIFFLRLVWKGKVLSQHWKLFLESKDFSQTVSIRLCTGLMTKFLIMSPRSWLTTSATPKMINVSRYVFIKKSFGFQCKNIFLQA